MLQRKMNKKDAKMCAIGKAVFWVSLKLACLAHRKHSRKVKYLEVCLKLA